MSELYRDLLERFEELKQRQDSQIAAESDSTRLRRLAKNDPSIAEIMQQLVDTVKQAANSFKTCALLAGSSMPQAQHHMRELDHIMLELECAAVIK
ncbi:hypothetical protein ANCDUO_14793 [Ancylostoma duodenale]|uniref:Uncharacterized protein n=1 Tax=Ancylostoma duodenale TaxID=51022 RepID=A0A0C2CYZ7_9BILA|nr:hypothetical protein ANCDUO_14793 [Ancylostoma duodenale]